MSALVTGTPALVPLIVLLVLATGFNLFIEILTRRRIAPRAVDWVVRIGNLAMITAGVHLAWGSHSPFLFLYAVFVVVAALRQGMTGARQNFALMLVALGIVGVLNWPLDQEAALYLISSSVVIGVVTVAAGMTGQRQIDALCETERCNRQLAVLLIELERRNRERNEFVQDAVHDLRNPLTYLQSYAELLLEDTLGPLTPEQRKAVGVIAAQTDRLDILVDDIALVQTPEMDTLQPKRLDLVWVTSDLLETATAIINHHHITLHLETNEKFLPICADRSALEQIIDNLISNAVKYSPDGSSITVQLCRVDGQAHLSVTDEGIGLTPGEVRQLFTRFYRTPAARQLGIPGTGLGLAIVKQLTTAYGGQVWVDSEPGRGSTFHVTFPLAEIEQGTDGRE